MEEGGSSTVQIIRSIRLALISFVTFNNRGRVWHKPNFSIAGAQQSWPQMENKSIEARANTVGDSSCLRAESPQSQAVAAARGLCGEERVGQAVPFPLLLPMLQPIKKRQYAPDDRSWSPSIETNILYMYINRVSPGFVRLGVSCTSKSSPNAVVAILTQVPYDRISRI